MEEWSESSESSDELSWGSSDPHSGSWIDESDSDEDYEEYTYDELVAYQTLREKRLFWRLEEELRAAITNHSSWWAIKSHIDEIREERMPQVYDDVSLGINLVVLEMTNSTITPALVRMALRWLVGVELNPGPACKYCGQDPCICTEEEWQGMREAAWDQLATQRAAENVATDPVCKECGKAECNCAESRLQKLEKMGYRRSEGTGSCVMCAMKECNCPNRISVAECSHCGKTIKPGSCACKGKNKVQECARCGKEPCECERNDMAQLMGSFKKWATAKAKGHCSAADIEEILNRLDDAEDMAELLQLREEAQREFVSLMKRRARQERDGCKICSKSGHLSYACPERRCRRCRKTDHTTSECTTIMKENQNRNNHKKSNLVKAAIRDDKAKEISEADALREMERQEDLEREYDEIEAAVGRDYFGAEDAELLEQMRRKYHKSYAGKAEKRDNFVASNPVDGGDDGTGDSGQPDEEIEPDDKDEQMRIFESARFAERVAAFKVKWNTDVPTVDRKFGIIGGLILGVSHLVRSMRVTYSSALWQLSWRKSQPAAGHIAKIFRDTMKVNPARSVQDVMDASIMTYNLIPVTQGIAAREEPYLNLRAMPWNVTLRDVAVGTLIAVAAIAAAPTVVNFALSTTEKLTQKFGIFSALPTQIQSLLGRRMHYWNKKVSLNHKVKFRRFDADPIVALPDRRHRQQSMSDVKCWNPTTAVLEYTIELHKEVRLRKQFPADMAIVAQVSAFGNTHAFLSAETCSLKITNVLSRLQTENYDFATSIKQDDAYANCAFVVFAIREAKRQQMEEAGMLDHFRHLGVYAL